MSRPMKVIGPSELIAAIPHVMGFVPHESVLVVPIGGPGPWARLDQPYENPDIVEAAKVLVRPYMREQLDVAVVCFTEDRGAAEKTCYALTRLLDEHVVAPVLWVDGDEWTDLATGITGQVGEEARARLAAESVFRGQRMPAASRDDLARDLQGSPEEVSAVAAQLPTARAYVAGLIDGDRLEDEAAWIREVVGKFVQDHVPLNDAAAARMLADAEILQLRDTAWELMGEERAAAHVALWRDLTRRSPEEVRTPAAALLAFSSWLSGNGAQAQVALDLVPDRKEYALAQMTDICLQEALPPKVWEAAATQRATTATSSLLQQAHLSQPAPPRHLGAAGSDEPGRDQPSAPPR
jgi:hypothetical protein